jgi:enoyl-[acyl-carrier-protein] reductase (NADH)
MGLAKASLEANVRFSRRPRAREYSCECDFAGPIKTPAARALAACKMLGHVAAVNRCVGT